MGMEHLFFDLHECGSVTPDEFGQDVSSLAEARAEAIAAARDVMSAEIKDGKLCLGCHIAINDASGREPDRVSFRDAVAISGL